MAYDEELTGRMRHALRGRGKVTEKRMMGGNCFFLNGNMIAGADRSKTGMRRFMFRAGKDNMSRALARPGAAIMEQGGRQMSGFAFVNAADCSDQALCEWIDLAETFVGALPPK